MHTLCCPFFLPAAAGRISKMYIHACIFTHPSQRADCTSKSVYTCRHIFLVILCIHMPAYFFPILRAAFSQPATKVILFLLFLLRPLLSHPFTFLPAGYAYFFAPFQYFCCPFFAPLFLRRLLKYYSEKHFGRKVVQN